MMTMMMMMSILAVSTAAVPADVEGSWRPVTVELGGSRVPNEVLDGLRLGLSATGYTITTNHGVDRGTVKRDPSKKPKTMDITGTEGPNQGKTYLAIYELHGDKLTICYDLTGKARPARFESTKGSQLFLVTYERDKP